MSKSPTFRRAPAIVVIASLFLALSCGGGGTGSGSPPVSGNGQVVLFISDNISFYKQVITNISGVRLVNSGTGNVCTVMDSPVTLDIANLTSSAHYVGLANCPAGRYNRIDIDFRKSVRLMDQLDAVSVCSYASYLDGGQQRALTCDPATDICTASIRGSAPDGSVLVQEGMYNDLGIDFDLKLFTVTDFGNSACAVAMTLSTISAADMNQSGRAHGVTGALQDLDAVADTFLLVTSSASFTVNYSGILPSLQPNLDTLLSTAQTESFSVSVLTGDIDIETGTIAATRVSVNVAGTVSAIQSSPTWSFTLTPQTGKALAGSHKPPAEVQGAFINGTWVQVKFDGYDDVAGEYLAASVEVLSAGTVLEY
jgi:hypothetical protein